MTTVHALTRKGPPPDHITSADGHVTVGFEKEWGGAISYIKDDRIPDSTPAQGNMINNSNGGALLSTAIWTLKNYPANANRETGLGWCDKRTNKYFSKATAINLNDWNTNKIECYKLNLPNLVLGSLPFNNPTQGSTNQDAWSTPYGRNLNPTTLTISNNHAHILTRMVNFNYSFEDVLPSLTNPDVQTDFWVEEDVYFHPEYKDVLVVDQKITYCRDMNSGCKNTNINSQDLQLSTLFPATTTYGQPFSGPFEKFAFREAGKYGFIGLSGTGFPKTIIENWQTALTKDNVGIGEAVYKFRRAGQQYIGKGEGYGNGVGPTALVSNFPDLFEFEHAGVQPLSTTDPRFTFSPGGWYKFRTFVTTGNIGEIRRKLLAVADSKMNPDNLTNMTPVNPNIVGHASLVSCGAFGGWATEAGKASNKITVMAEFRTSDGAFFTKTGVADIVRSDLTGVCPPDGKCAYSFATGNLPSNFQGKKITVKVWGKSSDGRVNLLTYEDQADSKIGLCGNIVAITSAPTSIPTTIPTSTPRPTATSIPRVTNTPRPSSTPTVLQGDIANSKGYATPDGHVDSYDVNALVSNFGKTGSTGFILSDINRDGKVNIFDYSIVVGSYGK